MDDRTLVMMMVKGIGACLSNEEKRAYLTDLRREHLNDEVCTQAILPEKVTSIRRIRVRSAVVTKLAIIPLCTNSSSFL
jgi:hypothetical protein